MGHDENSADLLRKWLEDIKQIIIERFHIPPISPTIDFDANMNSTPESLWRISLDNDRILVPECDFQKHPFLRGVLAREILRCSLLKIIKNNEVCYNLAAAFGREFVKQSKTWYSLWNETKPPIDTSHQTVYSPSMTFASLYNLDGEDALDELVDSILKNSRYGIDLTISDWQLFLYRFASNYSSALSSAEITIIDELMRNPEISKTEIGKRADISQVWVSTLISAMKKRRQLREFESVVYSKIGIRVFQVVLEPGQASYSDCVSVLNWCPYLYTSNAVVTGKRGLFATLAIPDNSENILDLHRFIQSVKRIGIFVNVFERHRSARTISLDSYDPDNGIWRMDWNAISLESDLLQRDEWAPVFPLVTEDAPSPVDLDERDIRLLSAFEKGYKTVRELRKEIRGRSSDITTRLSRLKDEDVIRKIWEIHHVGLNESALVIANNPDTAKICGALSLRLPVAYVDFDTTNRLLMRTFLPQGGIHGFASAMAKLTPPPEIHVLGQRYHGAYHLALWIDDWDDRTGAWMPASRDTTRWFDHLDSL
ncbi:MAG: hypothetical protein GF411_17015 [Candidatus Lokiarchaeota archaeon]|nr:hypothetical protein [Candidatus Lokiarchaeota archaeon]